MPLKSASKECNVFHYWYFLDKAFKFQLDFWNRCHDVSMMSINVKDIAILNIRGVECHCIITGICKCDAVNLLQNADLTEERVVL